MSVTDGSVFDAYPDGVALLGVESGTIVQVNDRCAQLCGRSRDALEGASLPTLSPDEWTPQTPVETLIDRARNETTTFAWRVERPDGTTVALRCSMRYLPDRNRALVTVRERPERLGDETVGSSPRGTDGSERTQQELTELLDGMNDAVMVVDFDGNFLDANRVALDRLGYTREELLSMGPADISPPEHAELVDDRLRRVDENESLVFESVQVTADGTEIPVEINARRITYRGRSAVLSVARDITDRKERRRKLRTFEQAVEQAGHAVYITDTDGTIEYVNPAFEEITGYDESEALGRTPAILSSGEQRADYYEDLWETILAGDIWEEQIANERADGDQYYAEQTIAPIVEDGDVVKFVAVQQDVTQRKEREHELERYQQLIENVPVGVYRNTPGLAGEFEAVNPAMVEMFDAESETELLETPVAELYRAPSQRELLSRKLDEENKLVEEEIRLQTLDGDSFWGAVSAIRHEIDGDVYYDGIIQDVTERREQARQLRLREQRFRRLFEDHNAAMLLIDPDTGAIERANDAAVEFYGYERETLTAMRIQDVNQLSDEEVARRRREADEHETNRFIFPHELADGEVRQVEVDSSPIHTGEKRLLFSIIHDVTEREENRRTLERQNEQLEVLNRVVRHDIRNDMTVITNYANLLAEYVDEAGREYLDTVIDHSDHAIELTRTVRELMEAMLEDGDDDSGTVSLTRVLDSELETAIAGYEDAEFTVERPLPDVDVAANEMLASVFRNLLNNAVQHNDAAVPEVDVSADERGDTVVVRVADNGPGVPDEQKANIFEQGEHGMDSAGTGLGLYLVYTFVEQFDGEVWVTDNDPRGAVFHVELPKAE